jgi:hypothetical protein
MKAGLLGAIGGAGKALEGFGSDLIKRREQALEDARELAKEQRRETIARDREDRQTGLRIDLAEMSQTGADRRAAASQAAITGRQEKSQEFQRSERKERAAEARSLADYKNNLTTLRTQKAAEFKADLAKGQIKGIRPGPARPDGMVQVLGVRGDGQVVPMPQWVSPSTFKTPTQNFGKAGGGGGNMLDDLDLEEEEEEEE